jgi:hypothetical protein
VSSGTQSIIYVWNPDADRDEGLLGFVESIGEHQWRAVGTRHASNRIWMYDLGSYPALARARAAIRINALIPEKEIGDRPAPRARR